MKRALLVSAVCLPLMGCFQTSSDVEPPPAPDLSSIYSQVVAAASGVCHFAPDFQTVVELFGLGPSFQSAGAIVNAICGAVTKPVALVKAKSGAMVRPTPTFRGVPIRGRTV